MKSFENLKNGDKVFNPEDESLDDGATWRRVRHLEYFATKEEAERNL